MDKVMPIAVTRAIANTIAVAANGLPTLRAIPLFSTPINGCPRLLVRSMQQKSRMSASSIAGVMRLGDLAVGAVMTPRHEVDSVNLADTPAQIVADLLDSEHSRLVVFDGDSEGAVGIVNAKELA